MKKMKKKYYTRFAKLLFLVALLGFVKVGLAQTPTAGDYRSVANGDWSTSTTWEVFDGTSTWSIAPTAPTALNNVYIQHAITLSAEAFCRDFQINTAQSLTVNSFWVNISGKMRAYAQTPVGAVIGMATGTFYSGQGNSTTLNVGVLNCTGTGGLRPVGASRVLIAGVTGNFEWTAGASTNLRIDFALDATAVDTIKPALKAKEIIFSSGTVVTTNDIRPDNAAEGGATLLIKAGATLKTNSGSGCNFRRASGASATDEFGSFTLENGGTLEFLNGGGTVSANTIALNGIVIFSNNTAQSLLLRSATSGGAAIPNNYRFLELSSSAKALQHSITVSDTLRMRATGASATSSIALGAFTLTYGANAVLQYRSTSTPQTTGDAEWPATGSSASMPLNVNIFNGASVTLNSNKDIAGYLRLNGTTGFSSKLVLGDFNLVADSVNIPTNDGQKYIVTNLLGKLALRDIGSALIPTLLFPVGPSISLYHPATITNTGTPDNFSVNVKSEKPACADPAYAVNATWDIGEDIAGGSNCALSLDYAGLTPASPYNAATAKIVHCTGTTADYADGSVTGTVATGSGFTIFSPFGVRSDAVVPISLVKFSGKANKAGNVLKWNTANEQNNKGFEIQRSTDGVNFVSIAFVNSIANNGYSSINLNYTYTDSKVQAGKVFYRLKQVDYNQSAKMSEVISLYTELADNLAISRLVANSSRLAFVVNAPAAQKLSFVVYDASGKIVATKNAALTVGINSLEIDIANCPSGVYLLQMGSNSKFVTTRFIK
jgi:hypothetical protein